MANKPEKIKKEVAEKPITDNISEDVVEKHPIVEEDFEITEDKDVKNVVRVAVVMSDKLIVVNSKEEGIVIPFSKEYKNVKVGDYITI